jgi:arylsulfatase A-like enzyme
MTERPNIVFLFTDDQRFDTIAALGNKEVCTPNLDELVLRGTAFTHAHIPGGTVGAVCMPSRAMLHSGRTLFHIEQDGKTVPEEHALLGETLRTAGYDTYGIGKWHNGARAFNRSFAGGSEIFFGGMNDHWNVPAYDYDPEGKYDSRLPVIQEWSTKRKVTYRNADHIHSGHHSTDLFTDAARKWLDGHDFGKPIMLYISYMAPHDPRSMPKKFRDMYDAASLTLPPNLAAEHVFEYGIRDVRDEVLAPYPRTETDIREHLAEYYAMITHLDDQIGKLVQTLKDRGQYDHTVFVLAGDNGLAVGQHGLMGKQSCYEHSVRVPLLFAGPGIKQGVKRSEFVYLSDIFPTLCELANIPIPLTVEGRSMASLLQGGEGWERQKLFLAYEGLVRAVKDRDYKLIVYREHKQLFDLQNDPWECRNLYGNEASRPVADKLMAELVQHSFLSGDRKHPAGKAFWQHIDNK